MVTSVCPSNKDDATIELTTVEVVLGYMLNVGAYVHSSLNFISTIVLILIL